MVKKANLQKLEDVTLKMKSHFAITVFLRNVFRKVTKKKDFSIGFFWRLDQNFDIVYI